MVLRISYAVIRLRGVVKAKGKKPQYRGSLVVKLVEISGLCSSGCPGLESSLTYFLSVFLSERDVHPFIVCRQAFEEWLPAQLPLEYATTDHRMTIYILLTMSRTISYIQSAFNKVRLPACQPVDTPHFRLTH